MHNSSLPHSRLVTTKCVRTKAHLPPVRRQISHTKEGRSSLERVNIGSTHEKTRDLVIERIGGYMMHVCLDVVFRPGAVGHMILVAKRMVFALKQEVNSEPMKPWPPVPLHNANNKWYLRLAILLISGHQDIGACRAYQRTRVGKGPGWHAEVGAQVGARTCWDCQSMGFAVACCCCWAVNNLHSRIVITSWLIWANVFNSYRECRQTSKEESLNVQKWNVLLKLFDCSFYKQQCINCCSITISICWGKSKGR